MDQLEFDRAVELLLFREFKDRANVDAVNGRGGDQGIDILMTWPDGRTTIVQLKYFVDGFSGKHSGRRRQVTDSLTKALTHAPNEWVLVVPSVPTRPDYVFMTKLAADNPGVDIKLWHRTHLDSFLTDHPEVINLMRRDPAVNELLTQWNSEKAALTGGMSDVADRVGGLLEVIGGSDDYWALDIQTQGDNITQTIRAKRPDAAERSPINIHFNADLTGHDAIQKALRRTMGFGLAGEVTFPHGTVKDFRIDGPPLVAKKATDDMQVTWCVPTNTTIAGKDVTLTLLGPDGTRVGAHRGRAVHGSVGTLGNSLQVRFHDTVTLTFLMPNVPGTDRPPTVDPGSPVPGSPKCALELNYDHQGPRGVPSVVLRATQLVADLAAATEMKLSIEELPLFHAKADNAFGMPDADDWMTQTASMHDLADDLDTIGRHLREDLVIPASMNTVDRISLRCIRLMLEGHAVMSPDLSSYNLTITDANDVGIQTLLDHEAGAILVTTEPQTHTVAGLELALPSIQFWHPRMGLKDRTDVAARVRAGQQVPCELAPLDGTKFRAVMPDLVADDTPYKAITPWNLTGVPQELPEDLVHPTRDGEFLNKAEPPRRVGESGSQD